MLQLQNLCCLFNQLRRVAAGQCIPSAEQYICGRLSTQHAVFYPTTNLFVFFKNFAGIGRSSCQVMFIGLLPVCFT